MTELAAIEIEAAVFQWPESGFRLEIPTFRLEQGSRVLLLGPSGGGKSTLLSLISGINTAQEGRVRVMGQDIAALGGAKRDRLRAERLGIIFQMFNLLPYLSPLDNALLPLRFAPARRRRAGPDPRAEARRLLDALGLPEHIQRAPARTLSVGQQQRAAAARALIGRPEAILADEPTSALDRAAAEAFLDLLFAEAEAAETALLFVSHDERLSPRFDRVVRLEEIARVGLEAAA